MDKQFTVSDVRRTAAAVEGKQMLVSSMLRAFADMLEAREKAEPVVTRESAINALAHVGQHNGPGRETEARQMLVEGSPSAAHSAQAQPQNGYWVLVPRDPTHAMRESAASYGGRGGYNKQRGDDAMEVWRDMLAAVPQPPAARVTDAMVRAAMRADFCGHNVEDALMCGTDWNTEVMRAALEAALAAQENPNG